MPQVLVADTVFKAAAKLTADEKGRILDFVGRFQANPANPGVRLERVTGSASSNVWSGRITQELRAILFKDGDNWAIVYADHHDEAYAWAERRKIGRHSVTGGLQVVEQVESVQERVPRFFPPAPQAALSGLYDSCEDNYLLSLGVPEDWLPTIRRIQTQDQVLDLCDHIPEDVAERLLGVAMGELVTPPTPLPADQPPGDSPDVQRRFFVLEDDDLLKAALEAPLEKWIAFLHPSQRSLVEGPFSGPCMVSGGAGTGKTVVAMHRARALARAGHRVLLTSYVTTLCENLERSLQLICTPEELGRITVSTVHSEAMGVLSRAGRSVKPARGELPQSFVETARLGLAPDLDADFVKSEWDNVIQVRGLSQWEEYRDADRTGRGTPLAISARQTLWGVFESARRSMRERGLSDWGIIPGLAEEAILEGSVSSNYTAVVVDEVQDLRPSEIRFVKALAASHLENLMLVGDTGQRVYPGGFSLRALGIEVRGRTRVLRINYRTTEQIRLYADQLLGDSVDDMDGASEDRSSTRSLLKGPPPVLAGYGTEADELEGATSQIQDWLSDGLKPSAIGVFARTKRLVRKVGHALSAAGILVAELDNQLSEPGPGVRIGTMHRAKGLEYKAVLIFGCQDGTVPNSFTINSYSDPLDQQQARERERRLLYVAMTRARDELVISWWGDRSGLLTAAPTMLNINA